MESSIQRTILFSQPLETLYVKENIFLMNLSLESAGKYKHKTMVLLNPATFRNYQQLDETQALLNYEVLTWEIVFYIFHFCILGQVAT